MTAPARSYRMKTRADGVARTRERLTEVAREHFVERPYDEVTLAEIAREAQVSQQTLLNHFSSKEGLLLALAEGFAADIDALRGDPKPGDVQAAVRGLMRQYERYGDANVRLAMLAERIAPVGQFIDQARTSHLAWIERVFGDQLPTEQTARRRATAQVYAATDVFTWRLLRRELKHSRADASAVMQSMVRAAVGPAD